MSRRVQLIRHTTGGADAFTGLSGEITIDTTKKEVRVHDSLTAGGIPTARADLDNVSVATTSIDGKMSAADKTKLDNIEASATGDQTGSEIKGLYEGEADTNAFNDAAQSKLAGIEAGATTDQTNAQIKVAYENNTNTNAFTDAEKSKLTGIENGATADQNGAQIKSKYEGEANTNAFTDAEKAKVGHIAVSQGVDLDTLESDVASNNSKVSNATHTGDVSGSTVLTIGASKVTTAMIQADAIDGTKIADNAVDSEHYVDGSIDAVHLAPDVIDGSKIADNAINSEHYVDGSIDFVHLGSNVPKIKFITITNWNTGTTATKVVAHGLTLANIRSVSVVIKQDDGTPVEDFYNDSAADISLGTTSVTMTQSTSLWSGSNYNGSGTRGYITLTYTS